MTATESREGFALGCLLPLGIMGGCLAWAMSDLPGEKVAGAIMFAVIVWFLVVTSGAKTGRH